MKLEGSCHCGAVRFSVESEAPCPYMRCYCSVCRKTAGGGGYAINLGGHAASLEVEGGENLSVYRVRRKEGPGPARRHFCKHCGSALWVYDRRRPELIHPFASAIDSALPAPPETVHMMLASRASWAAPADGRGHVQIDEYAQESFAGRHNRHRP